MWKSQRAICLKSTHRTSITRPHKFDWSAITRFTFYPFPPLFSTIAKLKHQNYTPLTLSQIFQDISADHTQKTVTIKPLIHTASLHAASMHSCKHTSIMKKVMERMNHSIVEEQLAQHGKPSFSMGKTPLRKRRSGFSARSCLGVARMFNCELGLRKRRWRGWGLMFTWFFSSSLLRASCWLLRLNWLCCFELALSLHPHPSQSSLIASHYLFYLYIF